MNIILMLLQIVLFVQQVEVVIRIGGKGQERFV